MTRNNQPLTQHEYLTKIANSIIGEDIGVTLEYRHIVKKPKIRPVCMKSFTNEIVRLYQGVDGRVEVTEKNSTLQQYTWK